MDKIIRKMPKHNMDLLNAFYDRHESTMCQGEQDLFFALRNCEDFIVYEDITQYIENLAKEIGCDIITLRIMNSNDIYQHEQKIIFDEKGNPSHYEFNNAPWHTKLLQNPDRFHILLTYIDDAEPESADGLSFYIKHPICDNYVVGIICCNPDNIQKHPRLDLKWLEEIPEWPGEPIEKQG